MATYSISIITPTGESYRHIEAVFTKAPAIQGTIGILANHAPMVSALDEGNLIIDVSSKQQICYEIGEGILEILPDHNCLVLCDHAKLVKQS